jgi:hypothetical protein
LNEQIGEYIEQQYQRHGCLRCAVCYGREEKWRKISVHHIVGRFGGKDRYNDPRNLILVCEDTCHEGIHRNASGCSLDLGHVLQAKWEEDGKGGAAGLDCSFLASLRGKVGLREDPKQLPDWVVSARKDNK